MVTLGVQELRQQYHPYQRMGYVIPHTHAGAILVAQDFDARLAAPLKEQRRAFKL